MRVNQIGQQYSGYFETKIGKVLWVVDKKDVLSCQSIYKRLLIERECCGPRWNSWSSIIGYRSERSTSSGFFSILLQEILNLCERLMNPSCTFSKHLYFSKFPSTTIDENRANQPKWDGDNMLSITRLFSFFLSLSSFPLYKILLRCPARQTFRFQPVRSDRSTSGVCSSSDRDKINQS